MHVLRMLKNYVHVHYVSFYRLNPTLFLKTVMVHQLSVRPPVTFK